MRVPDQQGLLSHNVTHAESPCEPFCLRAHAPNSERRVSMRGLHPEVLGSMIHNPQGQKTAHLTADGWPRAPTSVAPGAGAPVRLRLPRT